jgi:hypothetical protein
MSKLFLYNKWEENKMSEKSEKEILSLVSLKPGDPILTRKDLSSHDCSYSGLQANTAYTVLDVLLHVDADINTRNIEQNGDNCGMHTKFQTLDSTVFNLYNVKNAHLKVDGPGAKEDHSYPSNYFKI